MVVVLEQELEGNQMQACVVEADVKKGGCLELEGLPFGFKDHVEVIIVRKTNVVDNRMYSLRNRLVKYENPFEPVAESDWDVLNDNA